jgi:hypothetical protein
MKIAIIVSAGGASSELLRTCLYSLERHPNEIETEVWVVAPTNQAAFPHEVCEELGYTFYSFDVRTNGLSGSDAHGKVLDRTVALVDADKVLTLDADCFPLRDGWLDELAMKSADVSGIMQSYAPPSSDLEKGLERDIRDNLGWHNTHVACQLIGLDTLNSLGVGFADGKDTGLAIPMKAREMGLEVAGWHLTACGAPSPCAELDLELNRSSCLIYEDWMYHHGGGSRDSQGHGIFEGWRELRKKVLSGHGAEFMVKEAYKYKGDREEEIADAKVREIIMGMARSLAG